MRFRQSILLVICIALTLTGCGKSGISGAAMMRVEVEVYKGPVAQTPEIQIGELSALLAESARATHDWIRGAEALQADAREGSPGCTPASPVADLPAHYADRPSCNVLQRTIEGGYETVAMICDLNNYWIDKATIQGSSSQSTSLSDLCSSYRYPDLGRTTKGSLAENYLTNTIREMNQSGPNQRYVLGSSRVFGDPQTQTVKDNISEFARRISSITSTMRAKAFRVSNDGVHYIPDNRVVRSLTANYSFLTAEYANQIAARISALQKVIEETNLGNTNRRKTLPIGDYLRDVAPTAALDNFRTYNAGPTPRPDGTLPLRDRVRAVQGQVNDYYWEKINEVYASGQGDVAMAFVKDDLGNWNLKSFDNDPSQLLAAYRKGANALVKAAVDIAKAAVPAAAAVNGGAAALSRSARMLDMAERLSTGTSPNSATNDTGVADTLMNRARTRLTSSKALLEARTIALTEGLKTLTSDRVILSAAVDARSTELATAAAAFQVAKITFRACAGVVPADPACQASFDTATDSFAASRAAQASSVAALAAHDAKIATSKEQSSGLSTEAATQAQLILQDVQEDLATIDAATTRVVQSTTASLP